MFGNVAKIKVIYQGEEQLPTLYDYLKEKEKVRLD